MFENDRLKTGIQKLDDMIGGGLPRGEFMLIGGRPGMGKTSLLKQIIKTNEKTACLYLSDDYCFDHLTLLVDALCQSSNYDCYVVLDDLDQFKVGEEEAGFRLKAVAKQFSIPVIGAVKLPRDLEYRKNKRPTISDFHKGFMGMEPSIEQDADVILGLYRESYYNIDFSCEDGIEKDEIIVVKNRHGNIGTIDINFDGRKRAWEEDSMKYNLFKPGIDRKDDADEKRIELHAHTNMSNMDGVSSPETLISRAAEFGHKAIAITDTCVVQAFPEASRVAERLADRGMPIKVIYGMEAMILDAKSDLKSCAVLLAKNQKGLKNLYKLVSWSHLENLHKRTPCVTKEKLSELRDGLFVGCCASGELFRALLDGKSREDLLKTAAFYDYLEIQPADTCASVFENDRTVTKEQLMEYNRVALDLGEKLKIPVCATGNVYFCDPEDEVYRRILTYGCGGEDVEDQAPLYLRTTEEMLAAFSYLGKEKAREVVVKNPGRIADHIDHIQPIPRGTFYPKMDGSDNELRACVLARAKKLYGDPLPEIVGDRLERELSSIVKNGFSVVYVIAKRLAEDSEARGYHVGSRGCVGSSLVAFLAGITEVNPLPPHYLCPICGHTEFFTDSEVDSGFDLPDKVCPICSSKMKGDGHNVPFETFAGLNGNRVPDIDLNFAKEYRSAAQNCLHAMFGKDHVFFAGTVSTITEKTAYKLVEKFINDQDLALCEEEAASLAQGLVGIKCAAGRHPGGFVIIPEGFDAEDFTPLQYPASAVAREEVATHFHFIDLFDHCLKMDIFGYGVYDLIRRLEEETGVKVSDIPMNDPAVYSLFISPDALGVTSEEIECDTGVLSLPEVSTPFVRQMLLACKPECFSDLIKISGLSHGTRVWFDNAQDLINSGVCSLKDVAAVRDDIMNDLTAKGLERKTAFQIMEQTRKGRFDRILTEDLIERLGETGVPEWYIGSLKKIRYMFPKAHAVAYMIHAIRLGWYKLYYPKEYYKAYLSICKDDSGDDDSTRAILKEACYRGVDI